MAIRIPTIPGTAACRCSIRLLVYANEFELEGLIATSLAFGDGAVRPELLHEIIADYAKAIPTSAGTSAPATLTRRPRR